MQRPMKMANINVPQPIIGVPCGPSGLPKKIQHRTTPIARTVQSIIILLLLNLPPNANPMALTVISAGSIHAPATTSMEMPNAEMMMESTTSTATWRLPSGSMLIPDTRATQMFMKNPRMKLATNWSKSIFLNFFRRMIIWKIIQSTKNTKLVRPSENCGNLQVTA